MDILKNYYANKQEDDFYTLKNKINTSNIAIVNGEDIQAQLTATNEGEIQDEAAKIRLTTNIPIASIDKKQSKVYLAPTRWPEGSGINQFMRAEFTLENCELSYEDRTLVITIPQYESFTLSEGATSEDAYFTLNGGSVSIVGAGDIELSAMKLELLDNLREDILSKGRTEYIIGNPRTITCHSPSPPSLQ